MRQRIPGDQHQNKEYGDDSQAAESDRFTHRFFPHDVPSKFLPNRGSSAEGAKEGSQGQAKRRPWLQTQEVFRALKAREDVFDGNMAALFLSPFQGSVLKSRHHQGPRAPRLPLATFFSPLLRARRMAATRGFHGRASSLSSF